LTRAIGDDAPDSVAIVVFFVAERLLAALLPAALLLDDARFADGVAFFADAERTAGRRDVDFFVLDFLDDRVDDDRFDAPPRAELRARFAPPAPFFPRVAPPLRDLPPDFLVRVAMANSPHDRCVGRAKI
jgi:hypothetical protein